MCLPFGLFAGILIMVEGEGVTFSTAIHSLSQHILTLI